jgi:hypothetical protein
MPLETGFRKQAVDWRNIAITLIFRFQANVPM